MNYTDLPAVKRRNAQKSYNNFNLAIYCPVGNLNRIGDLKEFEKRFDAAFGQLKIGRVYLEDFRGYETIEKARLIELKEFFEGKGISTAGGITTCSAESPEFGFASLCYSTEKGQEFLKRAVETNAEIFDEFIFDDFYFLNCRCDKCIEKKGTRSWKEFRLEQKKWVTSELIMKPAKAINPDINVIVKFPQWFEDFNETGYDLATDTALFDNIYTGTETRNPTYSQQHLPKYLSYNTMRLYGSDKSGSNLGAWFDPYECTYNLTSYIEQAYLSLYAGAKEITLFCLGSLMNDPSFRVFPGVLGPMFEEADEYLGLLGNPVGAGAYHPSDGYGEKNIHSYLGQCGIPMEMSLVYPEKAKAVFLAESALADKGIVAKMQKTLASGGDVIVTSGFVKGLGAAFGEFGNVTCTDKKAFVNEYCVSLNCGVNISGKYHSEEKIIIPQLDYCTNDVWEIAAAFGNDNNFPIVLSWSYGNGTVSVITIPDDMGDLYRYPAEVLGAIRKLFIKETKVALSKAPAGIQLFVYDNDYLIVRSDLPYEETASILLPEGKSGLENLNYKHTLSGTMERISRNDDGKAKGAEISGNLMPGVNMVFKMV